MTLDITIGNAVIRWDEDDNEYRVSVEHVELEDAPSFQGDNLTKKTNYRSMAYGTAHEFEENYKIYFPREGVFRLSIDFAAEITSALEAHKMNVKGKQPGWVPQYVTKTDGTVDVLIGRQYEIALNKSGFDPDLARLMWFQWWVNWALNHCEHPAIEVR